MSSSIVYNSKYCYVISCIIFNVLITIIILPAYSQQEDTIPIYDMPMHYIREDNFYQRIESLAEEAAEDADLSELIKELEFYAQSPLNLNYATMEDLQRFFFLNDFQVRNFFNHVTLYDRLLSIYELQAIEGWDYETLELIRPFVTVQEERQRRHITFDDIISEGQSQTFIRYQQLLEEQKGYSKTEPGELENNPNSKYLGSPYRLYSRYRFTYYNNISFGFTAQKNPGEEFFKGSQPYGFAYYSGHLFLRDMGRIKSLAIGDFQAQFGQGLALWSNLSFGKSYDAINIKKNPLGLRQYTSTERNNFMRGVGSTIAFGNFEATGFISHKKRDANVIEYDTVSQKPIAISSLTTPGNARTPGELENKRTVSETIYGGNLAYKKYNFSLAATAYRYELGAELKRNLSFYNQFDFNNSAYTNLSIDYSYIFRNFNIFGEAAYVDNGGYAILNGLMVSVDPRLSLAILHRNISRDYYSLVGNSFTENTNVTNEKGLYLGLTARLSDEWTFHAYSDHFSFPWMKWRTYTPTKGHDYLTQINYRPSRQTEMYIRYRNKNKPLNSPETGMIRYTDDVIRQNLRFNISYEVSESFTFRNRFEFIDFQHYNNKQQGYMIYHDILYRQLASPWAVTFRYALFDTDGYDSRIYAYEHNVLYAFGFPFYSDKGSRTYLLIRYNMSHNIDMWIRLAQTFYTNRETIGTGLDQINGNTRSEITAQIRLKF